MVCGGSTGCNAGTVLNTRKNIHDVSMLTGGKLHMKTLQQGLLLSVFAVLLFPLTACALSGKALEGQVLEESTKKPIPDAIVVAHWIGTAFSFVESPTVCVHVMVTTTDAEGKYHFPFWHKESPITGVRDVHEVITAYKSGYEAYLPPGYGRTEEYRKNIRYLKPFTSGREERLRYLERVEQSTRVCRSPEAGEKNLLPFYQALYEEAKSLAETKKDLKVVDGFLAGIEIIELGYKEGMRRAIERAEKRDRQP